MSKWIYQIAFGLVNQDEVLPQPLGGSFNDDGDQVEDEVEMVCRAAFTASNLQANVTTVDGTNTLITRKNGGDGNQSISLTSTGLTEDASNTDSLADGDTFNTEVTGGGMHGNFVNFGCVAVVLDDGGSDVSMLQNTQDVGDANDSSVHYYPILGHLVQGSTEADRQLKVYEALTISNLRIYINVNTFAASTTYRTRIDGSNGNQSVSFSAAETGAKEDTTNSDTLSSGDLINYAKDSGGGSGGAELSSAQLKLSGGVHLVGATYPDTSSYNNNTSRYANMASLRNNTATSEAGKQIEANTVDDLGNLQVHCDSNDRNGATTVELRDDGAKASGGPTISISSSTTGVVEDTTNTFTTGVGDLINTEVTPSGSSGSLHIIRIVYQQGSVAVAVTDIPWLRETNQPIHELDEMVGY